MGGVSRRLDITRVLSGKWSKEEKGKQVYTRQWIQWNAVSKLCIKLGLIGETAETCEPWSQTSKSIKIC